MTRKKHNLITTGLTSELFLLAFLKSDSAYRLAKRLQNKSIKPETSKIYPALYALTQEKYLKYRYDDKEKFCYPNIERLVEDIVDIIKENGNSLDMNEIKLINSFLQNRDFFDILSEDIKEKMIQQPKGKHEINALEVFCERIGFMATIFSLRRKNELEIIKLQEKLKKLPPDQVTKALDEFASTFNPEFENEFRKEINKFNLPNQEFVTKIIFGVFKSMPLMAVLLMMSEDLLTKLCKLWTKYDAFLAGSEFNSKLNKRS